MPGEPHHCRIETGVMGRDARVVLVADGREVLDITKWVRKATLEMRSGDVVVATVELYGATR